MNKKCYVCGLVSFAESTSCRRCGGVFDIPSPGNNVYAAAKFASSGYSAPMGAPVPLASVNGVGTGFRSWSHNEDGTSEAIVWFCILYIPVFPIAQYRLVIVSDLENEAKISAGQIAQGLSPVKRLSTEYSILGKCRIDANKVMKTYFFSYLLMPIFLILPFFLLGKLTVAAKESYGESSVQEIACFFSFFIWLAVDFAILAQMLHRSRGARKG